mmetsp:Transcript_4871/g.12049  ORF Transcript_4871/g.12049 Transcript_4871/m.12049 type:complete len:235 (+) Transcript_4871:2000-2704(+)
MLRAGKTVQQLPARAGGHLGEGARGRVHVAVGRERLRAVVVFAGVRLVLADVLGVEPVFFRKRRSRRSRYCVGIQRRGPPDPVQVVSDREQRDDTGVGKRHNGVLRGRRTPEPDRRSARADVFGPRLSEDRDQLVSRAGLAQHISGVAQTAQELRGRSGGRSFKSRKKITSHPCLARFQLHLRRDDCSQCDRCAGQERDERPKRNRFRGWNKFYRNNIPYHYVVRELDVEHGDG